MTKKEALHILFEQSQIAESHGYMDVVDALDIAGEAILASMPQEER